MIEIQDLRFPKSTPKIPWDVFSLLISFENRRETSLILHNVPKIKIKMYCHAILNSVLFFFLVSRIYRKFIYSRHSFGKNTSVLPVLSRVPCRRFLLFLWKTTLLPRGLRTYLYFCDGRCSPHRSVCYSLCSNVRLPCLVKPSCICHTAT